MQRPSGTPLRAFAPAKINLGLHVLRRRTDGYHDLETVFRRIDWSDAIETEPADALFLTCSDAELPTDERNLCLRAALTLQDAAGIREGAHLHLEKNLPYGAGLGGGSSDAATTLVALDQLWDLKSSPARLKDLAASLGSDVPFFLTDATAFGTGRGEALVTLPSFDLPGMIVVVVPDVHVSTARAYELVTPDDRNRVDLPSLVRSCDLEAWRKYLVNDFQEPVSEAFPPIMDALQLLRETGADYSAMSGSGSAVFGIYTRPSYHDGAFQEARAHFKRLWRGQP